MPVQDPPLQKSGLVQLLLSLQEAGVGLWMQAPLEELHSSVVQGLPSMHWEGNPDPTQVVPKQEDAVVQGLRSSQEALPGNEDVGVV